MFQLNDKQVDFIFDDIRARGIKNEDLQYNLVDHVCCIIEQNLKEGGDFENFYQQTISKFYKKNLIEIEEETHLLINFKYYYTMKKIMNISGLLSALFALTGIIFKFLWWPGAGILLVLGFSIFSLFFLPIAFTIKQKQNKSKANQFQNLIGTFCGSVLSLSILFKIMHWPGANIMGLSSILLLLFVFTPIFYLSGVKNEETKQNTIITSVILILACTLLLALINVKAMRGIEPSKQQINIHLVSIVSANELSLKGQISLSEKDSASFQKVSSLKAKLQVVEELEKLKTSFFSKYEVESELRVPERWHELTNITIFETEDSNQTNDLTKLGVDALYNKIIKVNQSPTEVTNLSLNLSLLEWYNQYFNRVTLEQALQNICYLQSVVLL
ncbi:MAG: hypothetical protein ACK5QC_13725 [Bacteroidota bacterium]|jgi:hypothetical protein|nr:hypothetical protein [Bacteroidota bacterium]MCA6444853.1 hypothetical protein [Bacteroidota bacterium]